MPRSTARLEAYLQRAADAGEVVEIIYHGGSQPGTAREVAPRSVLVDHGYLRALDPVAGIVKLYHLEKIRLPQRQGAAPMPKLKRQNRTRHLSVTFEGGFAAGWAMAVPVAFRPALDILVTPVVIGGQTRNVLTEGIPPCYDFHRGDVLYDTPAAYDRPWGEALQCIRRSVQVLAAAPDRPHGAGKRDGSVTIRVYGCDGLCLITEQETTMSQSQFVDRLKSGRF